ncbi:hypothetical protein CHUAL_008985 [Chamberlinius hualienensis]
MDLEEWKSKSLEVESNFSILLGDRVWDEYKLPEESDLLKKKISYSLYGKGRCSITNSDSRTSESVPEVVEEEEIEDEDGFIILNLPYSDSETDKIVDIHQKCIQYGSEIFKDTNKIYLSFIFVCIYHPESTQDGIFPLIRLRKDISLSEEVINNYFIDHLGRVYTTWDNYLQENSWNGCWLSFPGKGKYHSSIEIEFQDQTERGKVLGQLDKVSSISSVTCGVVGVTSIAVMSTTPIAAPIAASILTKTAIASLIPATYSSVRNVGSLIDRGKHHQSLNPVRNSEARGYWMATAASLLSLGTMGVEKLFKLGGGHFAYTTSTSLKYLCSSLNIVSLSVDGFHILNAIIKMSERDEKVSKIELIELITDIFFFTHSVLTFHTAKAVIKEAQHKLLDHPRSLEENNEEENVETQMVNGGIQFVKPIKHINNQHEFYQQFHT